MLNDLDEAIKHCEEKAKELREQPFKEKMDIEDVASCEECAEEHEQLAEWLKELKSFKEGKNSQWIPTSEILPEEYGSYLVMWRYKSGDYADRLFYEITEYYPPEEDEEEGEWEKIEQAGKAGAEIMAWMPLPERYEPKEK
jgi:hypothetical protein